MSQIPQYLFRKQTISRGHASISTIENLHGEFIERLYLHKSKLLALCLDMSNIVWDWNRPVAFRHLILGVWVNE